MPFIKRFEDGGIYDSHNGYRSAAVVAKQKANGTYTEPSLSEEEKKNIRQGLFLLIGIIFVALMVLLWNVNKHQLEANNDAIVSAVVSSVNSDTGHSGNHEGENHDGANTITVLNNHYDGGNHIYLNVPGNELHPGTISKCDVDKIMVKKNQLAIVTCGGQSIAIAQLPYRR